LLGRFEDSQNLGTFSLDRMESVELQKQKFKMDKDFDSADYFSESYGIVVGDIESERIVLRAYGAEPYYLRDLPLHRSQREINTTEEYADFELMLKSTADFKAALMARGEWIEVLEPQSLAEEISEWHRKAAERYKK
jgi:predicted DNA-binding transcriptional regulator YafY